MEKMSKTEWFNIIKGIVAESNYEDKEEACAFLDRQVQLIASKAEKAKERAAAKKIAGDKLREAIENQLNDEPQTISQIADAIAESEDFDEITNAKISARLSQLVKLGLAEKSQVKVDSKVRAAYRRIN